MKQLVKFFLFLIFSCTWRIAFPQLSPGDLTKYHAELEGLFNCTKCHELGKGISEAKCLDCHAELKQRLDLNLGYHASSDVRKSSCIDCHSDHHGRNFEIIRFDENNFDHLLTGYKLEGAHLEQKCNACHQDALISDREIRKKEYTFLGLENQCVACHEDPHQGTLSKDCASCHDLEAFQPAALFDHAKTDFPLKGQHQKVDCIGCHPVSGNDQKDFQKFAGVDFTNCTSCHQDAHDNRFGQNCSECHTEASWHIFKGLGNFNHDRTDFALTGSHRNIDCFSCHENGTNNGSPFKEFTTWNTFDCAACHEDVHESRLGSNCQSCHSTRSFNTLNPDHAFDHANTAYTLEGKHQEVDCRKCHTGTTKIEPLAFDRCDDCHQDYHQGQFKDPVRSSPDCSECHLLQDFAPSIYTMEQHQESVFPLEGAHLATPCFSCHLKEEKWEFRNIGKQCNECHVDVHKGILDARFYPGEECQNCHTVNEWPDIHFDHSLTNFVLEGKHLDQSCNACHLLPGIEREHQLFSGLSSRCMDCHHDIHQNQFMVDGLTDCSRCHGSDNWESSRFNHDQTDFKLDGAHVRVDCLGCHREVESDNLKYIIYQIEDHSCASCHL